jgi:Tol biopolymer transport system component
MQPETGKIKTIAAAGGRAEVVTDFGQIRGAVWTPSNTILFAGAGGPILQVAATGGTPSPVTTIDQKRGEVGHRFPALLPDGDHFLYAALPGKEGKFDIFAGALTDATHQTRVFIGTMDATPVYADPGYLLYARQGVLAAVPFDASALKITGDPILLEDEPASILDPSLSYTAGRSVSLSSTGALAYYAAPSNRTTAVWLNLAGTQVGTLNLTPGHYGAIRISPDGARGVVVRSTSASESSLWLVDLARATQVRLSAGSGRNDAPVWSPDGTRVAFASDRSGRQQFFVRRVNDAQPEQEFYTSDIMFKVPFDWSPDGSTIVFNVFTAGTAQDVAIVDASGTKPAVTIAEGPQRELGGWVSPDGKWLAYGSERSGSLQIWVQTFPGPGRSVQVSEEGGARLWWSRDNRQLFWASSDLRSFWRADVVISGATFGVKAPEKIATLPPGIIGMDMTLDRSRILAITPERVGTGSVTVVQNWRKALAGR